MYSPDKYLESLYKKTVSAHGKSDYKQSNQQLLTLFKQRLGYFTDEEKTQLDPVVIERVEEDDYFRLRVVISTIGQLKMPLYVLLPKKRKDKRIPVVLAIHGHGYGNKAVVGLNPDNTQKEAEEYHQDFGIEFVKKGMVVVVPELVGFGERKLKKDQGIGEPTENSCYMIASQLLLMGKTLAGLRIEECKRVIDFIETLPEADESKIGCMGISGGGLVAAFTSALDNRICATVISGYTNTFKTSIMARRHCLDNHIPGILNHAEMPELIGLIAPRPLFIEAGTKDHLFPLESVYVAIEKLTAIYQAFNAEEMLDFHIFDGGHEINGEQSYDWLVDQLL